MKANITGVAHYLPPRVVTNLEISEKYPQAGTPEQIFTKTGILERRYSDNFSTSEMATEAILLLLAKTETRAEEIDCIIIGTLTQDAFFNHKNIKDTNNIYDYTPTAIKVIRKIGAKKAFGFDVLNACPSFLTTIQLAESQIAMGLLKKVIVCGSDRMSKTLNDMDYKTGILFGDAAAAVLIEPSIDFGIIGTHSKVVSDNLEDVYYKTPFSSTDWSNEKFEIDGQKVYKHGVTLTVGIIREYLNKNFLSLNDFKYIIPHQANIRMLVEISSQLDIQLSKFLVNIDKVGNTAGVSVPLCLSQKLEEGIISKGDRLLLVSFGAGYTLSVVDLIL